MTSRQHPSRFFFLASLVVLGLSLAACGGHSAIGDGGTQHDGPPPNCTVPDLSIIAPQDRNLSAQATTELKVRYGCDGQPYSGMLVSWEIVGDGKGSALSSASSQTDAEGIAGVTLTAGTQSATFQVRASAQGATPLTFSITVSTENVGTISVNMSYSGTVVFTEYLAYLFKNNTQCTAINAFAITGAEQAAPVVTVISAHPQFIAVPAGSGYTVAVVAKKGADTLGFGCTPSVVVTAGQKTDVPVAIEDIPISYNGVYDLENELDMSGLLPPSVDGVVDILAEMGDDHNVDGSVADDEWGVDPAAFLLDFVYRQFCKWECTSGSDWDSCVLDPHPYGDLKELYRSMRGLTPFWDWDGDQPIILGACGILDPTQYPAQKAVQNYVQGLLISYLGNSLVWNIAQMMSDLAQAINDMKVASVLTLTDIRPGRQGNFQHVLEVMHVPLHDWSGTLHNIEVDLASAGIGTLSYSGNTTTNNDQKLVIPPHTFQLKFGKLVQYIYLHGLLPLLGYSNSGEMFQDWVNCNSVAQYIYDHLTTLFSVTTLEGYCEAGLQAAGTAIDNGMANWISGSTDFTLQGVAAAAAVDSHRVATQLDGVPPTAEEGWDGHWAEGTANADFTGTFTGVRR